jgi:hypothetical protein
VSWTDGPDRPAWGWRLLAWTTLILVGLMPLPSLPLMSAKGLMLAAVNYVAIAGIFSYAYGRPPRPLRFWRIFATIFSLHTMASLGPLIHAFVAALWAAPAMLSGRDWSLSIGPLVVCSLACIALLRHSELLGSRQRSANRGLERVFA